MRTQKNCLNEIPKRLNAKRVYVYLCRDQILDFEPLAKNSEWLFFSLAKDADQLAF